MRWIKLLYISLVIGGISVWAHAEVAATERSKLSAADVIALSKVTEGKFHSLETKFSIRYFKGPASEENLCERDEVVARHAGERIYYSNTYEMLNDDGWTEGKYVAAVGRASAKCLMTHFGRRGVDSVGHISRDKSSYAQVNEEILQCMWERFEWVDITAGGTALSIDEARGLYTLTAAQNSAGAVSEIVLDRAKGFTPVSIEYRVPGKRVFERVTFSDFRQVGEGIWLPYRWTNDTAFAGRLHQFSISEAVVNRPISAGDLDLVFPKGTMVEDDFGDRVYKAGEVSPGNANAELEEASESIEKEAIVAPGSASPTRPAAGGEVLASVAAGAGSSRFAFCVVVGGGLVIGAGAVVIFFRIKQQQRKAGMDR